MSNNVYVWLRVLMKARDTCSGCTSLQTSQGILAVVFAYGAYAEAPPGPVHRGVCLWKGCKSQGVGPQSSSEYVRATTLM